MIKRINNILKNIYTISDFELESEFSFISSIPEYKYIYKRIEEEIDRRKFQSIIPAEPRDVRLIYVVKCNEFYKIGIAVNIVDRMISLSTGNPYPLELVLCKYFDDATKEERELHKLFKNKHVRGEWFELSNNDVDNLKIHFSS